MSGIVQGLLASFFSELEFELYAWGLNSYGQLGQNNTNNLPSPTQIGALTTWGQVSAGSSHALAVTTDGELYAWGRNTRGQLGNGFGSYFGSVVNRSSPVQIGALTNWANVQGGTEHSLAIKTDGTLWAWGNNPQGQLGDNTVSARSSPVQIGALTDWAKTAAGSNHSLAVTTDGELYAWGDNENGRLGINANSFYGRRSSPVQVGALTNWAQPSAANHSACTTTSGTLFTWGVNTSGQLGQFNVIARSSPVQVGSLSGVLQVDTGFGFTAAVITNGSLFTWGATGSGNLGLNDNINRSGPVQVGALTNWLQVTTGQNGCAAIKTDGSLWGWGTNQFGQVGDGFSGGTTYNRSSPVQIGALTKWTLVSRNQDFSLAVLEG